MAVIRNKVARVFSGALVGYEGAPVEVEIDIKAGLPSLQIVGMGNKAIDEARQRVRSAISNSLLEFPAQKVTVNLAPAELPKDGTHLDVPIALGVLIASGQLKQSEVADSLFAGELALTGGLRPIRGAIILAELARTHGAKRIFLPLQNVTQAQLVTGIEIIGIQTLKELYRVLKGVQSPVTLPSDPPKMSTLATTPTFDDIVGHEQAKRALLIAAAGRHNLLLSGSPGAGKSLLAKSLLSLLPPLTSDEALEVTKLHSLSSNDTKSIHTTAPLRAPHHSVTLTAMIGGGLKPRPGDISLAHKGVLFLDELPEYPRSILEALRQPLEDRTIHLSRLYGHITWPADVLLVATMNPCPCGYYGDPAIACRCSSSQIANYATRISGPLLDRIDLRIRVSKVNHEQFFTSKSLNNSQHSKVLSLVLVARKAQAVRYNRRNYYNAYASPKEVRQLFKVSEEARTILQQASKKLALTSRSYVRILRVARTIADLDNSPAVNAQHVAEAIQFR